jgi:hypothetical protein
VDWSVEASVSENLAIGAATSFSKTLASGNQPHGDLNP